MKKIPTLLAALILSAGIATVAQADAFTDQIVADLQSKGYNHIEIKVGTTTVKVEANNGTNTIEVTYDLATGQILSSETGRVRSGDDTGVGVEIEQGEDDDSADDDHSGSDHDGSDDDNEDDGDDDHSGSGDDGEDDDSGDDHGGDDDSGDDDSGDDDDDD